MARYSTLILVVLCAALVSVSEAAVSSTEESPAAQQVASPTNNTDDSVFSDYVEEGGKKYDVADPIGDSDESDSVQEDSTAEWQIEMVKGLFNQRKAEKDFINGLEIGGKTLNAMVNNITNAFNIIEKARKKKGQQLIREHFQDTVELLKNTQEKILSSLSVHVDTQSPDTTAVKELKLKVLSLIKTDFAKQTEDLNNLFKAQKQQIKQEHIKQTKHVKALFSLINGWKGAFSRGLVKSEKRLSKIAQSWDLL